MSSSFKMLNDMFELHCQTLDPVEAAHMRHRLEKWKRHSEFLLDKLAKRAAEQNKQQLNTPIYSFGDGAFGTGAGGEERCMKCYDRCIPCHEHRE